MAPLSNASSGLKVAAPPSANSAPSSSSSRGGSRELAGLLRSLEFLTSESWPTLETQTIRVVLEVAMSSGISTQELAKRIGVSGAAISRNVLDILGEGRVGSPGLKWVTSDIDPGDRRLRIIKLTTKGE